MKDLLRPQYKVHFVKLGIVALCAGFLVLAPRAVRAQAQELAPLFEEPSPLAIHATAPGYLGVQVEDIDSDKAQSLRLKEVRGALITLIDHDAPAGQSGLRVNDVVLAVNGQNVEGAEALRRMLREIPPGRKISLEISRDGNVQTLAAQLVDRKALDHDIWGKIGVEPGPIAPAPPAMGVFTGTDAAPPSGWHMSLFTSTLNVGALVEPLTSQMADYLGVPSGLMIKQVARKSEAAASGLKAFDVILKVGSDSISTSADWDRALRSNQGKPVQVTILRDRKQQTLILQVDSKHRSALEYEDLFGADSDTDLAELSPFFDSDFAESFSAEAAANANALAEAAQSQADDLGKSFKGFQLSQEQMEQLRKQSEALADSMKNFKLDLRQEQDFEKLGQSMKDFKPTPEQEQQLKSFGDSMKSFRLDPDQMKALQENAEKLGESMKDFKLSAEQQQELKQQAEKLRQSMKDFQVDPRQMEQLRQQMQDFQRNFNSDQMKKWQQQMEQFRQQMQQWQRENCEPYV